MVDHPSHRADLIAPCGINCRICLAFERRKNPCHGCGQIGVADSRYKCTIKECEKRGQEPTCSGCEKYCARLKNLDKRYRGKYDYSPIESLQFLREHGMQSFLEKQEKDWECPSCHGVFCVHRWVCPQCGSPRPKSEQELDHSV